MCLRICLVKSLYAWQEYRHSSHWNVFTGLWINLCLDNVLGCVNVFAHENEGESYSLHCILIKYVLLHLLVLLYYPSYYNVYWIVQIGYGDRWPDIFNIFLRTKLGIPTNKKHKLGSLDVTFSISWKMMSKYIQHNIFDNTLQFSFASLNMTVYECLWMLD